MTGAAQVILATALSGVVATASAVVLVLAGSPPGDGRDAAGVFPPWWGQGQVMAAAGAAGPIRQLGGVPFIVVVHDPAGRAPERLRRAGALFSVAPGGVAFCGS